MDKWPRSFLYKKEGHIYKRRAKMPVKKTRNRFFFCALVIFSFIVLLPSTTTISVGTKAVGQEEKTEQLNNQENEQKQEIVDPKPTHEEVGKATYYSPGPKGKKLALTAAHKTLKRGTIVRVEPIGRPDYQTIEVEITDRLPNIPVNKGIVIDLDKKAAIAMSPKFIRAGKISVKITVIE